MMYTKRNDFPILSVTVNDHPLIYVDNAATTQKPQAVLDAVTDFYTQYNANVARGVYAFGEYTSTKYEQARSKVAHFINAHSSAEIVFTSGTTDSINMAGRMVEQLLQPGDEVVVTESEHHSNFVVWQEVARRSGALFKIIPVNLDGTLQYETLPALITAKTKLVAVAQISNALGVHHDLAKIITAARAHGALVLVDAAQSIAHQKVDVQALDCDFLAFSGHKMLAPTGIGVLYIAQRLHGIVAPQKFGGGMVYEVSSTHSTFLQPPHCFEAGTPPIAQAIGLGAALDYITTHIDFAQLHQHEAALCARLIDRLSAISRIRLLGPLEDLKRNGHLVSFTVEGIHAHDVAAYLDRFGICVRAGHHCAQPLAKKLGFDASVRISFYCYNTLQEVDAIADILESLLKS